MSLSINTAPHIDPQMCRQCKGLCCQGHPGVWVDPARFLEVFKLPQPHTPAELQPFLDDLKLLMRDIDNVAIPAPKQQEHGCIFLGPSGCQLTEYERPCQCLALIPSLDTLIDGEIRCELLPQGSTAAALKQWRNFWQTASSR